MKKGLLKFNDYLIVISYNQLAKTKEHFLAKTPVIVLILYCLKLKVF